MGGCHHPTRWAQNDGFLKSVLKGSSGVTIPHGGLRTKACDRTTFWTRVSPSHTVGSELELVNPSPSLHPFSRHHPTRWAQNKTIPLIFYTSMDVTIPNGGLRTIQSMPVLRAEDVECHHPKRWAQNGSSGDFALGQGFCHHPKRWAQNEGFGKAKGDVHRNVTIPNGGLRTSFSAQVCFV